MREYAFMMVRYDMPEAIKKIQDSLPEDIIYHDPDGGDNYGKETDPHVTVAACLDNDVNLDELKKLLKPVDKYSAVITDVSCFHCDDYDVLKCNVVSQALSDTNKKILSKYESHSEYKDSFHPHMTIAYLKKGQATHFCKHLDSFIKINPTGFHFSWVEDGEEKSKTFEK